MYEKLYFKADKEAERRRSEFRQGVPEAGQVVDPSLMVPRKTAGSAISGFMSRPNGEESSAPDYSDDDFLTMAFMNLSNTNADTRNARIAPPVPTEDVSIPSKVDRDLLSVGIKETAEAIGADPIDLANLISYETGGTFDPSQKGPTTRFGQHKGLIQFGEPQAKEYGVDWDDPYGSQLGAEGAIAKYLVANGYKKGMDLLDMYSIVNAGGPGRYDAMDSGSSVKDKVREMRGAHRAKAVLLMGGGRQKQAQGTIAPAGVSTKGMDPAALETFGRLAETYPNLSVISAYRDPEHNARVKGAKKSQHIEGKAFDVNTPDMTIAERQELIRDARRAGFTGIGVYGNSLHFDIGPARAWGHDYTYRTVPKWAHNAVYGKL